VRTLPRLQSKGRRKIIFQNGAKRTQTAKEVKQHPWVRRKDRPGHRQESRAVPKCSTEETQKGWREHRGLRATTTHQNQGPVGRKLQCLKPVKKKMTGTDTFQTGDAKNIEQFSWIRLTNPGTACCKREGRTLEVVGNEFMGTGRPGQITSSGERGGGKLGGLRLGWQLTAGVGCQGENKKIQV